VIEVRWSAAVLDETRRVLVEKLGHRPAAVDSMIADLNSASYDADVGDVPALPPTIELPDANDAHVLAAAIVGEVDVIVTFNRRDFPGQTLDALDLGVLDPDAAMSWIVEVHGAQLIFDALAAITARLRRPPRTIGEAFSRFAARYPTTAELLDDTRSAEGCREAATAAVAEMTAVRHQQADEADAYAEALREMTSLLKAATASGDQKRLRRTILTFERRRAARTRQYNEAQASLRALHASTWETARTEHHRWIERADHGTADGQASARAMFEAWGLNIASVEGLLALAPRDREVCRSALDATDHSASRAALRDRLRAIDEEVQEMQDLIVDLRLLQQDIGERLA
jgi:hypothetical protein